MSGNHQIVSTATAQGELVLSIVKNDMPANDDEVVVKMNLRRSTRRTCFHSWALPIILKESW